MSRPTPEQPAPEQGTIRVTFHPLFPDKHELKAPTFTRSFPDLKTWQRVRDHLRWDYAAIEVEERVDERTWKPNKEETIYSGVWQGKTIFDRYTETAGKRKL